VEKSASVRIVVECFGEDVRVIPGLQTQSDALVLTEECKPLLRVLRPASSRA
jgi:hypothetical protein